ncbi:hypothetical protein [uncultured Pluralibacter sp.]|uniref:hypothetical protein n=1 Tax=uncultured Pluralibacter sp. TaxID=1490864 RepID=UPI002623F2A4|nr:hypothetical protein [uncultured Pluralibacter sp.]
MKQVLDGYVIILTARDRFTSIPITVDENKLQIAILKMRHSSLLSAQKMQKSGKNSRYGNVAIITFSGIKFAHSFSRASETGSEMQRGRALRQDREMKKL